MAINFDHNLERALKNIEFSEQSHEFIVHEHEHEAEHGQIIEKYGDYKWRIVDLLNENYGLFLDEPIDLHNWLNFNEQDEVAYFLSEAGSNVLNYSQFKAPFKYHLWLGSKGFIIAIEQKGQGFPAQEVHHQKIKDGEGAAFDFYRNCKSKVFFDDPKEARIVYMEYLF